MTSTNCEATFPPAHSLRQPVVGFDVIHGYRTIFPVPLAMASSWDPAVEQAAQQQAAKDSRAAGIQWTFTPMVDIARDARWGRIVEGAGEEIHTWDRRRRPRRSVVFRVTPLVPITFWPASSTLPATVQPKGSGKTQPRDCIQS
ncbi:glycoside hydrolase family 3 N-terminal domain-containing protein [Tunturibacter empetritectus]|uniref:beta-glucosidase n=1 Tax=Tunturiibacter lichenicola TaxID=2051959 RepID=A0A7W8J4F6_9BACT|nr:glycoside hydrolase family 3 N-terminal domain-containing protein [Edaphobacter lichenicola]MBB5342310.1 hypothetical protein [Edaphobacter lichenicola]